MIKYVHFKLGKINGKKNPNFLCLHVTSPNVVIIMSCKNCLHLKNSRACVVSFNVDCQCLCKSPSQHCHCWCCCKLFCYLIQTFVFHLHSAFFDIFIFVPCPQSYLWFFHKAERNGFRKWDDQIWCLNKCNI